MIALALIASLALAGPQAGQTASQPPPPTRVAQTYPPEQVEAGRLIFASQCVFCHGRDAAGGETGPDLTRSTVTADDNRGDRLVPIVRGGRADKGIPPFNLPDADMNAIVAFVHDRKRLADSQQGSRRSVDVEDLRTGDAEAGRR